MGGGLRPGNGSGRLFNPSMLAVSLCSSVALCGEGAVPGSIQSGVALRFPPHSKADPPAHPEGSPYLPDPLFVPTLQEVGICGWLFRVSPLDCAGMTALSGPRHVATPKRRSSFAEAAADKLAAALQTDPGSPGGFALPARSIIRPDSPEVGTAVGLFRLTLWAPLWPSVVNRLLDFQQKTRPGKPGRGHSLWANDQERRRRSTIASAPRPSRLIVAGSGIV